MEKVFFDHFNDEHAKTEKHEKIVELCRESSNLCLTDSSQALDASTTALDLAENLDDDENKNLLILALISVSYAYWYHNNMAIGETYAHRALDSFNESEQKHICEGRIWSLLVLFSAKKGEWTLALHHFEKAVKADMNVCCGKNFRMMQVSNLAGVYNHIGDYESALTLIDDVVDYYKENNEWISYCQILLNKGVILHKQNKYSEALEAINKTLETYTRENINDLHMKSLIFTNMASVKLDLYPDAIVDPENEVSRQIENEIGRTHHHYNHVTNTIRSYIRQNKLMEAEEIFNEKIKRVRNESMLDYPKLLAAGIILFKKKGDLQTVIDLQNELLLFKDQSFNNTLAEQQAKFKAIYEFEKSENEKEIYRLKNIELASLNEKLSQVNEEVINQKDSLISLNEQLQNMIAHKDRMFSVIAHDVRNPFQNLLTTMESLTDYYDDFTDSEKKKYLHKSNEMLHKLIDFFENLLEWARIQTDTLKTNFVKLKLNKIIDDVLYLAEDRIKSKRLTVVRDYEKEIVFCADLHMIQSVIRNLINNAIKFSYTDKKIIIKAFSVDNITHMSIIDEGTGISEEDIAKIFDPEVLYSQNGTDKERGFGIGLVLIKEFIKKHNGTLECKSTPGEGTTMTAKIPCCNALRKYM